MTCDDRGSTFNFKLWLVTTSHVHISHCLPSHLQWRPVKALLMAGIMSVDILVRVLMVRVESFKILPMSLSILLGKVFAGYDIISGEDIAIKFEPQSSKYLHLENEYNIYKSIGNHIGIPRLKWFGQERNQRVLVLSLLGPSLENIFVASGCRFKLRTVLAIADQVVCFVCLFYWFLLLYVLMNSKTSFPIWNSSTLDTSFTAISNPRILFSGGAPSFALSISSTSVSLDSSAILAPSFTPLTKRISR
jgi:hypothetical protein